MPDPATTTMAVTRRHLRQFDKRKTRRRIHRDEAEDKRSAQHTNHIVERIKADMAWESALNNSNQTRIDSPRQVVEHL